MGDAVSQSGPPTPRLEPLVIALTQVSGATVAIRSHGDFPTLDVGRAANWHVRTAVTNAGGRVIKSLGEGLLLTFPVDRARDAVSALQSAREKASAMWRAFDRRCDFHVKMTVGPVLVGDLGLGAEPTTDIWGITVHTVFKDRGTGFVLLPDLRAFLETRPPAG